MAANKVQISFWDAIRDDYQKNVYLKKWSVLNYLCSVFGIRRVHFNRNGSIQEIPFVSKLWSFFIIFLIILSIIFSERYKFHDITTADYINGFLLLNEIVGIILLILTHNFIHSSIFVEMYRLREKVRDAYHFDPQRVSIFMRKRNIYLLFLTVKVVIVLLGNIIWSKYIPLNWIVIHLEVIDFLNYSLLMSMMLRYLNLELCNLGLDKESNKKFHDEEFRDQSLFEKTLFYECVPYAVKHNNIKDLVTLYNMIADFNDRLNQVFTMKLTIILWLCFLTIICLPAQRSRIYLVNCIFTYLVIFDLCCTGDVFNKEANRTERILVKNITNFKHDFLRRSRCNTFRQVVLARRHGAQLRDQVAFGLRLLLMFTVNVASYLIVVSQIIEAKRLP